MMVLATDLTVRYVTPSVEQLLGYRPEKVMGTSVTGYLHPDDAGQAGKLLVGERSEEKGRALTELRMRHHNGSWRYVEAYSRNMSDKPDIKGVLTYFRDVTEHKILQEKLYYQAFHDHLTGLPNRSLFINRLEHAMARGVRTGELATVLFIDLDSFKDTNDSFGHEVGDWLLVAVGRRLQSCVRDTDTVARFGGDEFAVLLEGGTEAGDTRHVVERIEAVFREPISLAGRELQVAASIGAVSTDHETSRAEALLRAADAAMYQAKKRSHLGEPCSGSIQSPSYQTRS
jgi:diguanylate cyclase (GGDEF)-like protein/PAS domain S-box-containing protein